jgi:hypothetical protein
MDEMSIETMGVETELAYRRERFLAEAEADRQAHAVGGPRPLDRLVDWLRGRRRHVVAARGTELHASWR